MASTSFGMNLVIIACVVVVALLTTFSLCAAIVFVHALRKISASVSALSDAWRRTITVCVACGHVLFATDVGRLEKTGTGVNAYCRECLAKRQRDEKEGV